MERMMENFNYTLAIIIPNWNGGEKLECMLKSILQNTYNDYKVFVVDDQSTDNSLDVLRRFSLQDDRIHYTVRDRAPKGGQTCRNIGAVLAQDAKYMIFLIMTILWLHIVSHRELSIWMSIRILIWQFSRR